MLEWITGEDTVQLRSMCGLEMRIVYRKCSLLLTVTSEPSAVFIIEEWIMVENDLAIWSLERLDNNSMEGSPLSNFLGFTNCSV